jgi:DNA-binding transcriptional ArsR family regulator
MAQPPEKNPFRPGVGLRPLHLAGRDSAIGRFLAMLRAAPEIPANMRMTGLRGVGKSVLLKELADRATDAGWEPALLELQPSHNTDQGIHEALAALTATTREAISRAQRLKAAAGKAAQAAGGLGMSWGDISISYAAGSKPGDEDLAKALFDTTDLALRKGRQGIVLLLDEAQVIRDERDRDGEHPLSNLISAVAVLQRAEVPMGLVVCGLPTLTGNMLRARSYTERMFRGEPVDSLRGDEATKAFVEPLAETEVIAEDVVVEAVVEEVEGYPYFIQLWGAELWDAAMAAGTGVLTQPLLEAARPEIYRRLDIDFYEPRVATLTPAEQDVLLASVECPYPPLIVSTLNEIVEKSPGNVNVLLGRLVESGVLYRIRQGQYEYTAPKFREYLERRVA